MSEEWYIFGGFLILLLVCLGVGRLAKKKPKSGEVAVMRTKLQKAPPPLPVRRAPSLPPRMPNARALDYPKCPVDRCRNEAGKPQVIFWDSVSNCYACCHGHRFTGRE